jgi:hypothetical protein
MDCLELAGTVIIRTTVLGVAKEIADELKVKFNPNFGVIDTDTGFAVATTAPSNAIVIALCQAWADGWLTRHQNPNL